MERKKNGKFRAARKGVEETKKSEPAMSWNENNDDYEGDEVETWFIYDVRDRGNENADNEIDRMGYMGTPEIGDEVCGYRIVGINRRWNYIYVRR